MAKKKAAKKATKKKATKKKASKKKQFLESTTLYLGPWRKSQEIHQGFFYALFMMMPHFHSSQSSFFPFAFENPEQHF